jgi:succinyl-CoA synthetase alpha subunit
MLEMFQNDPQTRVVLMIGEIGGSLEEEAAAFIESHITKPVIAYIAGSTAPEGKRMGHAGAIISGLTGLAGVKTERLRKAGVHIVYSLANIGCMIGDILRKETRLVSAPTLL